MASEPAGLERVEPALRIEGIVEDHRTDTSGFVEQGFYQMRADEAVVSGD